MFLPKKWSPELMFLNDFFFEKNWLIFDLENWLWKYNFGTFWWTVLHWRIKKKILWVCWFLAKNLVSWDPPLKKFYNRTDLDWSATAIFMSRKEPNCFRKSLHDIASASSFYAWNENENNLQFLFLFFILLICSQEIFSPKTENESRISTEFLTRNTWKFAILFTFAMV